MKIKATNAPEFTRHLQILSKLAGLDYPFPFDLFAELSRLERQANRICTDECNGDIDGEAANVKLAKIEKKVMKLLPNVKTLFVNGDPRGYSLKIKESEARELNMHMDWGGYGILAPEF